MLQTGSRNKRTYAVLLAAALFIGILAGTFTGCSGTAGGGGSHGNVKPSDASRMLQKGYLPANNLEYESIEYSDWANYIVIDGLRDEAVEKAINDRIYAVFDDLLNRRIIPPYRGIDVRLRQLGDPEPDYVSIHCYVNANCCNLLSVQLYQYVDYNGSDCFSYSNTIPLNFDLATGRELTLADMFDTKTDYIARVSDFVDEWILDNGLDYDRENYAIEFDSEVGIAAPFKGIRPEQKFSFADSGTVSLIMDYETPEFENGFHSFSIPLSDPDLIAFPGLDTKKDLFTDSTVSYLLSGSRYYEETHAVNTEKINEDEPGLYARCAVRYNSDMPQMLQDELLRELNDGSFSDRAREVYSEALDAAGDTEGLSVILSYDSYFSIDGQYVGIDISRTENAYTRIGDDWDNLEEYFNRSSNQRRCFLAADGRELTLDDVFKKGVDRDALLRGAIVRLTNEYAAEHEVELADTDAVDQLACWFIEHNNGFHLCCDALYLSADPAPYDRNADAVLDYLPELGDNAGLLEYTVLYIPFRYLGCENLAIFD